MTSARSGCTPPTAIEADVGETPKVLGVSHGNVSDTFEYGGTLSLLVTETPSKVAVALMLETGADEMKLRKEFIPFAAEHQKAGGKVVTGQSANSMFNF